MIWVKFHPSENKCIKTELTSLTDWFLAARIIFDSHWALHNFDIIQGPVLAPP